MRLKLPQPNYTPFAPKDKLRLRISFLFYVALTFFLFICTVCTYHSCGINSIRRECCKGMQDSHLPMKTLGLIRSPGPILLQRVSPIVRTFHSGFNGSSNHVSLASRDNLCTLSHRPQSFSVQRESEREKNEYARTAAGDDELYLRYADNLPECAAYGSCFSRSSACLWLGTIRKKRSISRGLSISQTTESDVNTSSSVLLCIFLSK